MLPIRPLAGSKHARDASALLEAWIREREAADGVGGRETEGADHVVGLRRRRLVTATSAGHQPRVTDDLDIHGHAGADWNPQALSPRQHDVSGDRDPVARA